MYRTVKIGTRGSQLALWQASFVSEKLQSADLDTKIVVIETKGDKILNQPFAAIGSKGIFTEEIESQLLTGQIDLAVHSAKDMQSILPRHLELIAFMEREEPNDVVVSHHSGFSLSNTNARFVVGTSSARRKAMLREKFPHLEITEARGNLQTRIRKMEEGNFDAMILAYAGIHRMNYDHLIREKLSLEDYIPAVGQGSIAIEIANTLDPDIKNIIRQSLNHTTTEICIKAERSFLKKLEGGCSIPIFALGTISKDVISLKGGISNLLGTKVVVREVFGDLHHPELLGTELADIIFSEGGKEILNEIYSKKS